MTARSNADGSSDPDIILADPYSAASKSARTQHLLGFMQRNAELEARVKMLEEVDKENKTQLTYERELRGRIETQLQEKQSVFFITRTMLRFRLTTAFIVGARSSIRFQQRFYSSCGK